MSEMTPNQSVVSRAAVRNAVVMPSAANMGAEFSQCRYAYFSCMDQFCGHLNEQYRRCICSGRLNQVRERERNFATAAGMLQDFSSVNLHVVGLTAAEVRHIFSGTAGESAIRNDNSASAGVLSGISDVLNTRSTSSAADNMIDMGAAWGNVMGVIGGADLANLEGTALYNAVHSQCAEMVAEICDDEAAFSMIVSAYGMHIEQDCTTYMEMLDRSQNDMIQATREARGALAAARLDNHDALNSADMIRCLDLVRREMSHDSACGTDNINCVDVTGRFVYRDTGRPRFTPDFWMLAGSISLHGDTLQSSHNMPFISLLNSKRPSAEGALNQCRDIADAVWDEYLRQTLVDLYQRQFSLVRDVRNECISTVNQCYDDQLESLREFASDVSQESVEAQQIGMSEELCHRQLETCALLYGGGPPGMQRLRDFVRNSRTVLLENTCEEFLMNFAHNTCTPINDNLRGFPYGCRFNRPGGREELIRRRNTKEMFDDSLYFMVEGRAMEVCTRQESGDVTHEVEMIINLIMDGIRLRMDYYLERECERISTYATWHSNVLGNVDYSESDMQFQSAIGSHPEWGVCRCSCPCTGSQIQLHGDTACACC